MNAENQNKIAAAKKAALEVLLNNSRGTRHGLPRTAAWGYPEPYTRDLMLAILGVAVSGNSNLIASYRKVLEKLSETQSEKGHIPSLANDKEDRGASDTTPLFLLGVGIYRKLLGDPPFLKEAVEKALLWMEYQSPTDQYLVAQQPTSDWRDEQWVLGYGLFVNTIVYSYLRILGHHKRADALRKEMGRFTISAKKMHHYVHEGLVLKHKPYYALWSYKVLGSERFDLLGNSLAILSGLSAPSRSRKMITWIEKECEAMEISGDLAVDLPPNFFPFIKPRDLDWHERYSSFNLPGDYHNGGIWPFISGIYIAALVAAEKYSLAEKKLLELTRIVSMSRDPELEFGFNEWIKAQDGTPKGQDWQTWSAALYLYAAHCVENRKTTFFEEMRNETVYKDD
ncbi:glycoside hydrolase 100 family protein [Salegentibacter sediminis]|uniref:glycoside hydrolase 100 family protein n=1 Tax=Salegentibacter sediminis TaxID=1930251 RepID=UPI0009BFE796|nr:glycoside hydrolase 100 family protein [Salegentibacter sediminis]